MHPGALQSLIAFLRCDAELMPLLAHPEASARGSDPAIRPCDVQASESEHFVLEKLTRQGSLTWGGEPLTFLWYLLLRVGQGNVGCMNGILFPFVLRRGKGSWMA